MILYHWTTAANAAAIRAQGFTLDHAGTVGGGEFGPAMYLAPTYEAALAWEVDMRYFGASDELLAVTCTGRLYDLSDSEFPSQLFAWAATNGLVEGNEPTAAGLAELEANAAANPSYHAANPWVVRMLQEQGYDGLTCINEGNKPQAVIWNIACLQL